jgi:hypothetical protein
MAFHLLGVRVMILRAAILVAVVIVVTVDLEFRGLRLFLMTFRGGPFGFLVSGVVKCLVLSLMPLTLGRMPAI